MFEESEKHFQTSLKIDQNNFLISFPVNREAASFWQGFYKMMRN